MDNNQTFEAEAGLDAHSGSSSTLNGAGTAVAANGGYDKQIDEDSPLLPKSTVTGRAGASGSDAGDGEDKPKWQGEHDFSGLSWWYRPSVCAPYSTLSAQHCLLIQKML